MVYLGSVVSMILHILPAFLVPFAGGCVLTLWWKEQDASLLAETLVGCLAAFGVWTTGTNALTFLVGSVAPWLSVLGAGGFGIWWWNWRGGHVLARIPIGVFALVGVLTLFLGSLLLLVS